MQTDERIDAYIQRSAEFAKPILNHLRTIIHKTCVEVEETVKWSFPHFLYKGSILCSMASFKQHCAFTFWLGSQIKDPYKLLFTGEEKTAMGHFGPIRTLADLPADEIFSEYIKEAMALIERGAKAPKKEKSLTKAVEAPASFLDALRKNKNAFAAFERFSPSHKKEYIEWITEAKREETRNKRIETAIKWIDEGKSRNWNYQRS